MNKDRVPSSEVSSRQDEAAVMCGFLAGLLLVLGFVVVFWLVGLVCVCVYAAHIAASFLFQITHGKCLYLLETFKFWLC